MTTTWGSTVPVPMRKRRCRVLSKRGDRCTAEELTDFGLCLRHLRGCAEEWERLMVLVAVQSSDRTDI
jgi:hypothetical protein